MSSTVSPFEAMLLVGKLGIWEGYEVIIISSVGKDCQLFSSNFK
jgi:hypothetical protein